MSYKISVHIREILIDVYMYKHRYSKFKINKTVMFSGTAIHFNPNDICKYIIIKNEHK